MSEKTIVELKKEDRDLLRSNINAMKKEGETKPAVEHKHEETPKHEHFSVDLAYMEKPDACPDCKTGLEAFGDAYFKKALAKRQELPFECVNCGLGVSENEEKCVNCGSKEAKKRD